MYMYMCMHVVTYIGLPVGPALLYPPHCPHIVSVLRQLLHQLLQTLCHLDPLKVQRLGDVPVRHSVLVRGEVLVGNVGGGGLAVAGADLVTEDDECC